MCPISCTIAIRCGRRELAIAAFRLFDALVATCLPPSCEARGICKFARAPLAPVKGTARASVGRPLHGPPEKLGRQNEINPMKMGLIAFQGWRMVGAKV